MFLFGKKASVTRAPRPATPSDQKRQAYRASFEFPVVYVVDGRPGTRTAVAGDLSAGGLRLVGDEDFPDETTVDFRFALPNHLIAGVELEREVEELKGGRRITRRVMVPPEPFGEMAIRGKTVITFFNVRRRAFAHGVQFLDVDERTREEIQRFIHVWQIRQLRERAQMRGE